MSEDENSKSKGKRLEEKEKMEAELERSLAVAKVKEAHKQIEETEKLRKRPIAQSICKRIDAFLSISTPVVNVMVKPQFVAVQMTEGIISSMDNLEKAYGSIRYDFQKNLDIGDEGMAKMFPEIKVRKDNFDHATADILEISTQIVQMKTYCERLIV